MGFPKEIILYKNHSAEDFSALELIDALRNTSWKTTLSIIDRGNKFDWIQLKIDIGGEQEFENVLRDKTRQNEYIGFQLYNKVANRYVTVNIDKDKILFNLDINRNEEELYWFEWYQEHFIKYINKNHSRFSKIEWRSKYDNDIIKTIENKSKSI